MDVAGSAGDQVRRQKWMQMIQERNESGMTIKECCSEKGWSENQHCYWLRKIRRAARAVLESRSEATPQNRKKGPVFAEVNILESNHYNLREAQ